MKILLISYAYAPSVGGIESSSQNLFRYFQEQGHQVRVVTHTLDNKERKPNTIDNTIYRRPSILVLLKNWLWADIIWQNNISLHYLWPLLLLPQKIYITIQTWIYDIRLQSKPKNLNEKLKEKAMKVVTPIAISKSIASHLSMANHQYHIIGNPYDHRTFHCLNLKRDKELIFVGRLVADKGCNLLLLALAKLKNLSLTPSLTIVGEGPELQSLKQLAKQLDIDQQITFTGIKQGKQLNLLLNQHHIMIIPSIWSEPFGIVALEGMSAGCVPIASENGGLGEIVQETGLTFSNGNVEELTEHIQSLLSDSELLRRLRSKAKDYVEQFTTDRIGNSYLHLFSTKSP